MSAIKELLDVRKRAKAKKPVFRRQDWHLLKKFGEAWRRPRGQHSKMRLKVAGRGALVNPGYRSPRDVRGLSRDGKEMIRIATMKELQHIDGKKQTVIISATVSGRHKVELLKAALKNNIMVYNIKNPAETIKKIEDAFKQRKAQKQKRAEPKKEAAQQKVEKKGGEEVQKSAEEKEEKEQQRKEAEKIMIQK